MTDVEELMDVAATAARTAGELLLEFAGRRDFAVRDKRSVRDLVTDADVAAETRIVEFLAECRPGDGVLGEEQGDRPGSTGVRWLVDPLDGTTNFVYGRGDWSVSVACEDADGLIAGAVLDPVRDELYLAGRGRGAWRNGTRLGPVTAVPLGEALVNTGFHSDLVLRQRQADILPGLLPRVRDLRRNGSAALDLAAVAAGRADAYFEAGLNRWDWSAGVLLVRECGGTASLTDLDERGLMVAAAPELHDELVATLAGLLRGQGTAEGSGTTQGPS